MRYGLGIALSTLSPCCCLHEPKTRFLVERLVPLARTGVSPAGSARLSWRTKVTLNVCIDDVVVSLVTRCSDRLQGLCRAPLRAESITAWLEICLEDRLDHHLRRHLHHSVPHRRYPQRPLLPRLFWYVSSPHREWTISAFSQCRCDLRQKLPDASLFGRLDRFRINPCRPAVATHSPPGFPQDVTPVDPVIQRMEAPCLTLLGTHI